VNLKTFYARIRNVHEKENATKELRKNFSFIAVELKMQLLIFAFAIFCRFSFFVFFFGFSFGFLRILAF